MERNEQDNRRLKPESYQEQLVLKDSRYGAIMNVKGLNLIKKPNFFNKSAHFCTSKTAAAHNTCRLNTQVLCLKVLYFIKTLIYMPNSVFGCLRRNPSIIKTVIMQNEPKFSTAPMNISCVLLRSYEAENISVACQNEPKTKPNKPDLSQFYSRSEPSGG